MNDVEAIPKELRRKLTFVPVSDMSEVLDVVLCGRSDVREQATTRVGSSPAPTHASFKPRC